LSKIGSFAREDLLNAKSSEPVYSD